VRSMAMLHEALYQSEDLERIPVKNYIHDLATQILESYGGSGHGINLNLSVEEVNFTIDTAIPCGLIINELITNALKHAFPDGSKGEITILLHSTGENELELVVRDNGQGMPKEVVGKGPESLGLTLVRTFVKQLHGEMKLNGLNGAEFRIRFKNVAAKTR
jgi:two-component sensor histidine kinase